MKKIVAFLLTITMILAIGILALAGPDPVPGNPAWNTKYTAAATLDPSCGPAAGIPNNPRSNASGDKIPSNAHSADFPGIYFYWNDKQKDNGVLLVLPEVFDLFVDGEFTLTAKNSNNYWGYAITKDPSRLIDGVYAYGIPKQFQYISVDNKGKEKKETESLKNINMVFIDGNYKDGKFYIEKTWYDEECVEITDAGVIAGLNALLSFNNGYKLGENIVKINDYKSAYYGANVTVVEGVIKGYGPLKGTDSTIKLNVKWNVHPTASFYNKKLWAHIIIDKVWVDVCDCVDCACTADECIEICGVMYHKLAAPTGVDPKFEIDGAPANLGDNKVKEGTYVVSELKIDGWKLISDNNISVTVEAGEKETVTFYNELIKRAEVEVVKVWEKGWGDGVYNNGFVVEFTDGKNTYPSDSAVFKYSWIKRISIDRSFEEIVDDTHFVDEDADYYYYWELDKILIEKDGAFYDEIYAEPADLTLYNGDSYVITFYNIVDRLPKQNNYIGSKIPSKTHVDRWWDDYGILAYGGNSGKDKFDYYLAFSTDFWDLNESVKIGYGTNNNYLYTVTITYDSVTNTLIFDNPDFVVREWIYNTATFDTHYVSPKEKNHVFDISIGALIDNVYTSGSRQIWLLEINEK